MIPVLSHVKSLLSYFYNSFLDSIYKRKCLICGCSKTDDLLCKNCAKDINYLSSFAYRIYNKIPIYCASIYENNIKKLIQLLKFSHKKTASIPLAQILFTYFRKLNLEDDYIIIYPDTFFLKKSQRGYNHMFLISKELSKLTGFKVENNLINKIKHTKPQYKAKNRHKNIKGSFKVNERLITEIKDKNILLIDDITTSGATLEEIINCLKEKGIDRITCLVVAKAGK